MPKFLSLEAKVLNYPTKRTSLWCTAQESNYDIMCVQKTHFKNSTEPHCTNKNFTHIYQGSGPT